jgi:excisionase family DNA binding protein
MKRTVSVEAFMDYEDASKFLKIKKGTLYSLVSTRRIPHHRLSGRLVRFSKRALEAWINGGKIQITSPRRQG